MKVSPELGSITHRQSGCFTQIQIDMGKLLLKYAQECLTFKEKGDQDSIHTPQGLSSRLLYYVNPSCDLKPCYIHTILQKLFSCY